MGRNQLVLFCLGSVGGVWNPTGAMMQEDGQENQICTRQLTNQSAGESFVSFGPVAGSQQGPQEPSPTPEKLQLPPSDENKKSPWWTKSLAVNDGLISQCYGPVAGSQQVPQERSPEPQKCKLSFRYKKKTVLLVKPNKPILQNLQLSFRYNKKTVLLAKTNKPIPQEKPDETEELKMIPSEAIKEHQELPKSIKSGLVGVKRSRQESPPPSAPSKKFAGDSLHLKRKKL
jgi:hypothetical protein